MCVANLCEEVEGKGRKGFWGGGRGRSYEQALLPKIEKS